MVPVASLIRTVLSLPELGTRTRWLIHRVRGMSVPDAAVLLDALCKSSERGDSQAHEALIAWVVGLIELGECALVSDLRRLSQERDLHSLHRMLRQSMPSAPTADSVPPVPDYGAGRELTVGERRTLARRPNRKAFERLLSDPHPLVLRTLLHNPRLTENDVVRLAGKRPLRYAVVDELSHCPDWLVRPRVRMTLIHNPGTPSAVAQPLLVLCKRDELEEVVQNTALSAVLRTSALELHTRRPPLGEAATRTVQ